MKKMMGVLLVSFVSISAFADLSDCQSLLGKYSCEYQGNKVDLELQSSDNVTLNMSLAGDSDIFTVDGVEHNSKIDDSKNTVSCSKEEGIVVINKFKETQQRMSLSANKTGISYRLDNRGNLDCVRAK